MKSDPLLEHIRIEFVVSVNVGIVLETQSIRICSP